MSDADFRFQHYSLSQLFSPSLIAEAAFRIRMQRRKILGADLSSDPFWDILLLLFLEGKPLDPRAAAQVLGLSDRVTSRCLHLLNCRGLLDLAGPERDLFELSEAGKLAVGNCCRLPEDDSLAS